MAKNIPKLKLFVLPQLDPCILGNDGVFLKSCLGVIISIQIEVVVSQPIVCGKNWWVFVFCSGELLGEVVNAEFAVIVEKFSDFFL